MTRAELQKEAQPFCEASFTMVIIVLASPQTSFGVHLSRIHFSPTDKAIIVFNYVPIICSNKLDKNSYSKYSLLNSCASMHSTHESIYIGLHKLIYFIL